MVLKIAGPSDGEKELLHNLGDDGACSVEHAAFSAVSSPLLTSDGVCLGQLGGEGTPTHVPQVIPLFTFFYRMI